MNKFELARKVADTIRKIQSKITSPVKEWEEWANNWLKTYAGENPAEDDLHQQGRESPYAYFKEHKHVLRLASSLTIRQGNEYHAMQKILEAADCASQYNYCSQFCIDDARESAIFNKDRCLWCLKLIEEILKNIDKGEDTTAHLWFSGRE